MYNKNNMGDKKVKSSALPHGLKPADYVHLHNHTHYSVLDGMTKVDELISRTKEFGMNAVAITDHGTMSGVLDVYKTAKAAGIKPILGIETYMAARKMTDRDPQFDKTRYHLTLLAMNATGYRNLMYLSTQANIEGYYYRPRIDHNILEKYNEGIICLSGCGSGEIARKILNNDYEGAKELVKWYHSVFGDRFYLEMQDHGHPDSPAPFKDQTIVNEGLIKLSKELDLPLVVTCDGHYLDLADRQTHEILLCVGTGAFLSDERRMSLKDFELYYTDPKDIIARWGEEFPEAIRNTKRIAERCNVEITLGEVLIPQFPLPEGETSDKEYLSKLTYRGAAIRYGGMKPEEFDAKPLAVKQVEKLIGPERAERLAYELGVIAGMQYDGYFLIVQDFINWGKSQGIVFGPGRGSAAGSIISYCLGITDLDPLKYDLLFERFLNPDRISMPDIDIDIQDDRRDEVVNYCVEKYGAEKVSNIGTFGKMAARQAVRDVARVLEVPYVEADRLSKMIPSLIQGRHVPLAKSIQEDPDLKAEYHSNARSKEIIDFAMRLEGTIRSHGVHACGVVVAPDDLVKYVPLERAQKGVIATQFPMGEIEEIGLLKMDFLGLSNLTIINDALRIIRKVHKKDIDISKLSLDDPETFKLFQRGDTTGVFQLESAGMKKYLRELKPDKFEDIIAMVALYRPGPMQFIDSFIKRKHGQEKITYLDPAMKPSLENTYGILVYQEQFMQISKDWCGFTGGQADTLRKAVGKKKIDLMKQMRTEFVDGAVKHGGAKPAVAEKFWAQLEEFANYCFNKPHAACYALVAYWTAYLKANYPSAFMAALMTSARDDTERLAMMISECNRAGIEVLAPSINESFAEFAIVPNSNKIRFGMAAVKGVGMAVVEEVTKERKKNGKFKSIADFAKRMAGSKFNRKAWEALTKTGAFDEFADRSDILENLELIQNYMSKSARDTLSGQADLFGALGEAMPDLELQPAEVKATERERLLWERELLGLYVSAHPLDKFERYLKEQTHDISQLVSEHDGKEIIVGGTISQLREFLTKKGDKMAFMTLEDKIASIEVIVFPKIFEEFKEVLEVDKIVVIKGRVSSKTREGGLGEPKVIANQIVEINEATLQGYEPTWRDKKHLKVNAEHLSEEFKTKTGRPKTVAKASSSTKVMTKAVIPRSTLYLRVEEGYKTDELEKIRLACQAYPGRHQAILVIDSETKSAIRLPFRVDGSDDLLRSLKLILGDESVILKTATNKN